MQHSSAPSQLRVREALKCSSWPQRSHTLSSLNSRQCSVTAVAQLTPRAQRFTCVILLSTHCQDQACRWQVLSGSACFADVPAGELGGRWLHVQELLLLCQQLPGQQDAACNAQQQGAQHTQRPPTEWHGHLGVSSQRNCLLATSAHKCCCRATNLVAHCTSWAHLPTDLAPSRTISEPPAEQHRNSSPSSRQLHTTSPCNIGCCCSPPALLL
jgi:hypothetical protein